jgi:methylamine---glutamate N-methyltransferase subunit C
MTEHAGYAEGRSPIWSAETIRDIHAKAELGRYQIRGFSAFRRFPTFDDLVFLPAVMTRLPLEGYREHCETRTVIGAHRPDLVERPLELDIPVYLTSMSFGALGTNAKMALGRGFTMAGSATCTGEGGMLPEERDASKRLIYQMTPSRYGLDLEHLRRADAIEIALGQGAKPGTGGLLLGMKVSEKVARMRTLPVGVDQRACVRHPDFLGADDLQVKI